MGCGVFGAQNNDGKPVFPYVYWGLRWQNHRGHQSHGICTYDGSFHEYKNLGLVPIIKKSDEKNWIERYSGNVGIGNIRYTTSGGTNEKALIKGTQPFHLKSDKTEVALSFNGNIVNTKSLVKEFGKKIHGFSYECDAELLIRKLFHNLESNDLASSVSALMQEVEGAFSVAGITKDGELFAFRDPLGIRPLCYGYDREKELYAISSESTGLNAIGLAYRKEIKSGELMIYAKEDFGFSKQQICNSHKKAFCGFEFAYFARPDSKLGDEFDYVYEIRERSGRNLAKTYPHIIDDTDIIISMPETGDDSAYGVHEETGKRWERCSRRSRYVTERAFILLPEERPETIDKKINILGDKIRGNRVLLTDDSIVRGDTTRRGVCKLRNMGARKIHLFVTFPRITGPCFYGIDMATYGQLIGFKHQPEEIAELIGADSVSYQSVDDFVKAIGTDRNKLCLGCVTGEYPTPLAQELADMMREKLKKEGYQEEKRIYD